MLTVGSPVWVRIYRDVWVPSQVSGVVLTSFLCEDDEGSIWERWMEDEGTEWRERQPEDVEPMGDFNDGIEALVRGMATWTGPMEAEVLRTAISKMKRLRTREAVVAEVVEPEVTERVMPDAEISLREVGVPVVAEEGGARR